MANLLEIAELTWRQLFPNPTDETAVSKEEFIASAKVEFAYQSLLMAWKEKNDEGYFLVPSYLSSSVDKEVVNNEIDISDLKILRSLPQEVWLQNIGGLTCQCRYVKSNVNISQLLCDDDSLPEDAKTYVVIGQKILFPRGTHKTSLPIIYANSGENVEGTIEVDGAIGALVKERLVASYGGKTGQEDETNNSNSQN